MRSALALAAVLAASPALAADYSVNGPALPAVGAGFANGYTLVRTVTIGSTAAFVTVKAAYPDWPVPLIEVVDDGTAAAGAAPVGATVYSGDFAGTVTGRLSVYTARPSAWIVISTRAAQ